MSSIFKRAFNTPSTDPLTLSMESLQQSYMRLAMEAEANGRPFKEIEHTIYAKLTDFNQLKLAASVEHQEQWELRIPKTEKNAGTGTVRIRKTQIPGADATYVLTTKVKLNDMNDKTELEIPTNSDNFTLFQFLSDKGMVKERYRFPIEGTDLVWEIDAYPKPEGGYHEWVKIDLEVENRDDPIPALPINAEEVIMPVGYGRQDPEATEKRISEIYDRCFLAKNIFLQKVQQEAPQQTPVADAETQAEATETSETKTDTATMVEDVRPASVAEPRNETEIAV